MPIYDYRCQACGHELEAMQKMAAAPLVDCPACNKPTLKKKMTLFAPHLIPINFCHIP